MATRESIPPEVIQKARRALELIRIRAEVQRSQPKPESPPPLPTPAAPAAAQKTPRTP